MRRFLFVLWFGISGAACAEEDIVLESDLNGSVWMAADFWTLPECPDDFGPIVVEMPPDWGYETATIDCGRIVSTVPDWCKSLHENCDDKPGWYGEECTCEWYRLRLTSPATEADE